MGSASNIQGVRNFNGDYRKLILVHLGQFPNLKMVHYKNLSGAQQYELDRAFDALTDAQIKTAWDELEASKQVV